MEYSEKRKTSCVLGCVLKTQRLRCWLELLSSLGPKIFLSPFSGRCRQARLNATPICSKSWPSVCAIQCTRKLYITRSLFSESSLTMHYIDFTVRDFLLNWLCIFISSLQIGNTVTWETPGQNASRDMLLWGCILCLFELGWKLCTTPRTWWW